MKLYYSSMQLTRVAPLVGRLLSAVHPVLQDDSFKPGSHRGSITGSYGDPGVSGLLAVYSSQKSCILGPMSTCCDDRLSRTELFREEGGIRTVGKLEPIGSRAVGGGTGGNTKNFRA